MVVAGNSFAISTATISAAAKADGAAKGASNVKKRLIRLAPKVYADSRIERVDFSRPALRGSSPGAVKRAA